MYVSVCRRDIEVLTGEKQECDGSVEKLKTYQIVLQAKCVHTHTHTHTHSHTRTPHTRLSTSLSHSLSLSLSLSVSLSVSVYLTVYRCCLELFNARPQHRQGPIEEAHFGHNNNNNSICSQRIKYNPMTV